MPEHTPPWQSPFTKPKGDSAVAPVKPDRPERLSVAEERAAHQAERVTAPSAPGQPVVIAGIDVPFGDLVVLYFKLAFAAVPTCLVLWMLYYVVVTVFRS